MWDSNQHLSYGLHSQRLPFAACSAFELCNGWHDNATVAAADAASGRYRGDFLLQGSYTLVKETEVRLRELMTEAGIATGKWTLPVFLCEDLQSSTMLPVFFDPEDLAATWVKAGRSRESLPDAITMMDLRQLVAQMQTNLSPWKAIHFIASPAAIKLLIELQSGLESNTEAQGSLDHQKGNAFEPGEGDGSVMEDEEEPLTLFST